MNRTLRAACVLIAGVVTLSLAADPAAARGRHGRGGWSHDSWNHSVGWRDPGSVFPLAAQDRKEQSFALPGGQGKVVIDDIAGTVRVRATAGEGVRVVAHQFLHAANAEDLALARSEMGLDLSQHGDTVIAFVDCPFRDGDDLRMTDDLPYRVVWDFDVEVPRGVAVVLRTVIDGDIELAGTDGSFEVRNVNGNVKVRDVAGAGSAKTVNGDLDVSFRRNPPGDCDFGNVNGDVDVTFQAGLGADVRFKTLNGDGWSDFPFTTLPFEQKVASDRRNGRFVVKGEWSQGIRIGAGGPQLSFGTINGDVLIRRAS